MTIMVILMKRVSVAELKARLSEYLAAAKRGENVIVTEHGKPIAQLTPLDRATSQEARLAEMIRIGLITPPRKKLDMKEFLARPRSEDPDGAILKALLEEREENR